MSDIDNTYIPKVYMKQGGDEQVVKADGILNFYGEQNSGLQLRAFLRRMKELVWTNLSTGSTVLSDYGGSSPPVVPSEYGVIIFSCTTTLANGSARMCSGIAGEEKLLIFGSNVVGAQSIIIAFSGHASGISGVKCRGSVITPLSSIKMGASAASYPFVLLRCVRDSEWAVIASQGYVVEQASA